MKNWFEYLEKKYARFAIQNLMYYIIVLYGVGFLLNIINPGFYLQYLSLNPQAILKGEVWRLITFVIQPPSNSLLWTALALYVYYMIGTNLERTMGAFRFNLYFFFGLFLHILACILIYLVTGQVLLLGIWYLNLSLFLLFAAFYPDTKFLLFFIFPVSAKYMALIDGFYFALAIVQGILGRGSISNAVAAAVSLLNFFLFFLQLRRGRGISRKDKKRRTLYQKQLQNHKVYEDGARHKCFVCGRTDVTNPELDFRYCSKCQGNREYCQDHLFTHIHNE